MSHGGGGVGCNATRPRAAQAAAAVSTRASAWYVNASSFVDSATAQRTPPSARRTTPAGLAAADDVRRKPPDSRALAGLTFAPGVRELRALRALRGLASAALACRNEFPRPFRTWCDAQRWAPRAKRPSRWPSCWPHELGSARGCDATFPAPPAPRKVEKRGGTTKFVEQTEETFCAQRRVSASARAQRVAMHSQETHAAAVRAPGRGMGASPGLSNPSGGLVSVTTSASCSFTTASAATAS